MKILVWMLLIAVGAAIIYYRFKIYGITGEWDWANKYVGNTMVAIILFGMLLIGAWAAYPFGALDGFGSNKNILDKTNSSK